MSHVSTYKGRVKNIDKFKEVLDNRGIKYKENCTVSLYGSNKVKAELAFKLEGWRYEIAVTENGDIKYDHFGSQSNTFQELGMVLKEYNKGVIMDKMWEMGGMSNMWEVEVKDATKLVIEY